MADSIKTVLANRGLLAQIPLPQAIDELLAALIPAVPVPAADDVEGDVALAIDKHLGFLALDLKPPGGPVPYRLIADPGAGSFRFWLVLSDKEPAKEIFTMVAGLSGGVLTPASIQVNGHEERLVPAPGTVSIKGVAVAILIEGRAGQAATMRLSPTVGQPAGIIALFLDPPTVLLGGSGFGLELGGGPDGPGAFVIDDSAEASPPGQTILDGQVVATRADDPAWRGLAIRHARVYLPGGTPLLGGHAVEAFVEVGSAPGEGIDLAIATRVPPNGSRPGIAVRIECRDPTATGLQDFIPTLVEATMELPLDGMHQDAPGGGFDLLAGKPVLATLRFARSVADPDTRVSLSVSSQGPDGVLAVVAPDGGPAARVLITAAALATAIVADKAPAGADTGGVVLHALLAAALGLSSCLKDKGRLTIHKVEVASSGHGLPVGGTVKLLVDYSVDVLVRPIDIGVLSVQMRDEAPMRVRNRNVGLRINLSNPAASGVETVELDFSAADMEIEDPGAWLVNSPGSLFDILGTRSGRGSTWMEVDLRFKLNLGPVKVTGATIRATLEDDGTIDASLRGLDASLDVPGAISGGGRLAMLQNGGLAAALDISIPALNLSADGAILYVPTPESFLLFVQVGVDLPGPIPVANTGLGIYGISGAFGINARPTPPPPEDTNPILYQLRWDSSDPEHAFEFRDDNLTLGAQAVVGTVPDLGFSFSTRAGLFLTVPDLVIRGSLWATVFALRMGVTERPPEGGGIGLSFMGVVVVDTEDGVTIGLKGELNVPVLLEVVVPLGAHFPAGKGQSDNWYIYLGADGHDKEARALGPMRATVLPDIIGSFSDAYVMFRGRGITEWPRGGPVTIVDGFVLAFGFGVGYTLGVRPIAWAEIHASADLLLATQPLTLAGFGTVGGSLNLGPFSIAVDATLSFLAMENADPYIQARVCGHIDLFFTEIEGCVEMSINNKPTLAVPEPDVNPLDDFEKGVLNGVRAFLIDDKYRRLGRMATDPATIREEDSVWPDTLLHLAFAVSPALKNDFVVTLPPAPPAPAKPQFAGIDKYPVGLAAEPVGNDMLQYVWTLTRLALFDVTGDEGGAGTLVNHQLSAAWQAGADGDLGTRPQAGDLVLLTYKGDLRLHRLADGGAGLADDPLQAAASACLRVVSAQPGWAIGFDADLFGTGFVLPANPLSPDRCVSRFTASLTHHMMLLPGIALGPASAGLLPPPLDYTPAELEALSPEPILERRFPGVLDLPMVSGPLIPTLFKRSQPFQSAHVVPEYPLRDARLWLLLDGVQPANTPLPVAVVDDRAGSAPWTATIHPQPIAGRTAVRFVPGTPGFVTAIDVNWLVSRGLGVLGLGGITAAADAAAALRNAATKAEAQRLADAAAKPPQPPTVTTGPDVRCVLDPARTYCLEVTMQWAGTLFDQDDSGKKKQAATGTGTVAMRLFFKTTPKPKPKGAFVEAESAIALYGTKDHLTTVRRRYDRFEPEMLSRFLLGYTPAQTETARFCDDALDAHFSAGHVLTLAKVYGYELKLGLRRVDVPGAEGDAAEFLPEWAELKSPSLLTGYDKRTRDVAAVAACAIPKPGGTLSVTPPPLTPLAWYELYALAKSDDPSVLDGRLDGVTFRTSRWHHPAGMLAGLGFTPAPGAASGDVELAQLLPAGPAVIDGSDADFEAALDGIGLDGWPPVSVPRVSLLWQRVDAATPRWLCAGLLLESPEPIDRPGRCDLGALRLVMQPLPAGAFDVRRSDRQRSRVLWLCSTPFTPRAFLRRVLFQPPRRELPTLALELTDKATGVVLRGSLALPLAPSFAEEA